MAATPSNALEAGDNPQGKAPVEQPNFGSADIKLSDVRRDIPETEPALKGLVSTLEAANGENAAERSTVAEVADTNGAENHSFSRAVENNDGSRLEYSKLPNGKEVVSTVVHPSGEKTIYGGFDASGQPANVKEFDAFGNQTSESSREGNIWSTNQGGRTTKTAGELTVGEDGSHHFKDAVNGNEFVREANGRASFKDRSGEHEIKGPDEKRREPADRSKPIDGAEAKPEAKDTPPGEVSRAVERPDGSRVEFSKLPNGQEVVSTVVHPSGEKSVYSGHDDKGQPSKVMEYDAEGKQIGESTRDGNVWTVSHKAINGGQQFKQVGELSVDGDGNHKFKDLLNDTEFTRKADGSLSFKDATGKTKEIKGPDDKVRKPEAQIGEGSDVRRQANADGSELQFTRLASGQEVVTEVIYPSGQSVIMSGHDDSGQPTKIEEFDPSGNLTGVSQREGNDWTVTTPQINEGKPFKLPGTVTVDEGGNQIFTNPETGEIQAKRPDGAVIKIDKDGKQQMVQRPQRKAR